MTARSPRAKDPAARAAFAVMPLAFVAASCSAVLGLDAPELACGTGTCDDAGGTAGDGAVTTGDTAAPVDVANPDAIEAASETGAADAPAETGPLSGLRCGDGAGAVGCEGATPWCCAIIDDAGDVSYACRSDSSSCEGYPIRCASDNDCPGNEVCCMSSSKIDCGSCSNASLVCDPAGPPSQCDQGKTCSVPVVVGSTTLPYDTCSR